MSAVRNELFGTEFVSLVDESLFRHAAKASTKIKIKVVCPECGIGWTATPKVINYRKNKHSHCVKCSMHLSRLVDISGNRFGSLVVLFFHHTDNKSSYWECLCDCGNKAIVEKQNLRRGSVRSCGCLLKNNGGKLSGKDHPNYNPDITDLERKNRRDLYNNKIKEWRKLIYERDDFSCAVCHRRGIRLNAHHLYSWKHHKNKRFRLDNGITLCKKCHRGFHEWMGGYKVKTTEGDFIKWKQQFSFQVSPL